jgi:hypothetical protein
MCCKYGEGGFKGILNGNEIFSGGSFKSEVIFDFNSSGGLMAPPTESPTTRPTTTPTDTPSKNPTQFPTVGQTPTDIPSKHPTLLPTEEVSIICEDSEEFRYRGNDIKTCSWIRKKNRNRRKKFCKRKQSDDDDDNEIKIFKWCPTTCGTVNLGSCASLESITCEDSEEFRYRGKDRNTCSWLGKKNVNKLKRLCKRKQKDDDNNKIKIFNWCPTTCGTVNLGSCIPSS